MAASLSVNLFYKRLAGAGPELLAAAQILGWHKYCLYFGNVRFRHKGLETMKKIVRSTFMKLALLIAPTIMGSTAQATIIDFNAFSEGSFGGGVEDGFTISATSMLNWAPIYGFPTLSIGANSPNTVATASFVNGGLFQFDGFDIVSPNFTGPLGPVAVDGFVGAALVASDVFSAPVPTATPFSLSANNLLGVSIDRLVISITSGISRTPLVDNIRLEEVLAPVPVPATMALLGIGLLGLRLRSKS